VSRLLRRLDLPLKKRLSATEGDPLVQAGWRTAMTGIDPTRLVFSEGHGPSQERLNQTRRT
jgi:hypothetical protein